MRVSLRCASVAACAGGLLAALGLSAQDVARVAPAKDTSATHEGDVGPARSAETPTAKIRSQYTLGASDVLRINVWKSAELSQTVTIGPDGFISLPLLGDMPAAGMTAEQLAKILSDRLGSYIVSPQVTVSVLDFRSRQVFVTGQVGKPGAYSLIAPITVLQLIAQAGGLNTFANRKAIFVLRGGQKGAEKLKFNYTSALKGDIAQNITLVPGDTVIVP